MAIDLGNSAEEIDQIKDRFWQRVATPRLAGACWIWTGGKSEKGYGRFYVRGRLHVASRVSYVMQQGKIPEGQIVCHSCDNPSCVNPDHLWLGTSKDNYHDMVEKGRRNLSGPNRGQFQTGEKPAGYVHNRAKLRPEQAAEIRRRLERGEKPSDLAGAFGISRQNIYNVAKSTTWAAFDTKPQRTRSLST